MAIRQQAIINSLSKYCRQYFLYADNPGMDPVLIRLRNETHRVEEADYSDIEKKMTQRTNDCKIGLLNPQTAPYQPVSGWPYLNLDDLVFDTMAEQLDPRAREIVRSLNTKTEIKKVYEKTRDEDYLKDYSAVHSFPTAGYNFIKTHLAESQARMQSVKAGMDFHRHFIHTRDERLMSQIPDDVDEMNKFTVTPEFFMAKERVRRDAILFLVTVKDLLEKMLLLRTRHLKSHTPICLATLGSEKDREANRNEQKVLQYPRGPPAHHNFKDQIMAEAPEAWPLKAHAKGTASAPCGSGASFYRSPSQRTMNLKSGSLKHGQGLSSLVSESEDPTGVKNPPIFVSKVFEDPDMCNRFRKRWPPSWISMASLDQGCYFVDPLCPTKEYNACLGSQPPKRKKSLSDIMVTRRNWAHARHDISKTVEECMWRVDKEKLDVFKVQCATLFKLPVSLPYLTYDRRMRNKLKEARRRRQKVEIYDCELTKWYKYLVERMHAEVGGTDEEVNELLASIKVYFKMSATSPKYGKAKLALITMSLPAYTVLLIYVQRAILFVLEHVLGAPPPLLVGWLAARGLPFVLKEFHIL